MGQTESLTILVVDDEWMITLSVADYLTQEGFRVLTAGDGLEALRIVRDERPDLVITDHMMPRMNGLELAQALKQDPDFSTVSIVLTSAIPPRGTDGLFTDVFIKPYQLADLAQTVRKRAAGSN